MSHEDRIRQRQIERLRQRAGKASDATAPPDDRVFSDDAREKLTAAGQGLSQVGKGLLALGQKASQVALEKAREAKADLDAKRAAKSAEAPLAPTELAAYARPAAQAHGIAVHPDETALQSDLAEGNLTRALLADTAQVLDAPAESQEAQGVPAADRQRRTAAELNKDLDVSVSHRRPITHLRARQSGESAAIEPEDAMGLEADTAPAALKRGAPIPTIERVPQSAPAPSAVVEAPRSTRSTPSNRPEHAPLRKALLIAGAVLALAVAAGIAWWATRDVSASDEPERHTPVQAETHEEAPPAVAPEMSPVAEPIVEAEPEAAPVGRGEPMSSTLGIEPATAAPALEPKAEPKVAAKSAAPKPLRQATPKPTSTPAPVPAAPMWQDEADAAMDAWMKQR